MGTFILTWVQGEANPAPDEYEDWVARTEQGEPVEVSWDVGGQKGIEPGDRAFLLRQRHQRGLIACGIFESAPFPDDHWDGSGRQAHYATVTLENVLSPADRLPIENLLEEVPEANWNFAFRRSGRRLSDESADKIEALWDEHLADLGYTRVLLPEEVPPVGGYPEGTMTRITVNRFERDPRNRAASLAYWGHSCVVCGFDFVDVYGDLANGSDGKPFIVIHHVRELSTVGVGYKADPKKDLVPLCPNCHAMVHRKQPAYSPEELRQILTERERR